ncbi:MAG: RNA 2',3'-cyclic phosphodiesterase [Acidobacteriia bacterium]|nr:RNA 2',3'-cyclic phosphodiesterase [Terriglobia bacterium]
MRIFIALDIPEEIRKSIARYVEGVRPFAPDARWTRPESLHVTLKFVGQADDAKVEEIRQALLQVKAPPLEVGFRETGFFPGARAPRVFWAGVEAPKALPALAAAIDAALEKIGIAREDKPYHPHLTLARAGSAPAANRAFRQLPPKLPAEVPQFGTMTAQEFFLYKSEPLRGGSRYTKLERFPLKDAS